MNAPALITTPPGTLDVTRLAAVDTATLKAALRDGLKLTVSHLAYVAAIWKELESRGEDLRPLATGIGAYLALIAAGDAIPETVVNFAGKPALLRKVAALPVAEQRAIADGAKPAPEVRKPGPRSGPSQRRDPVLPGMPAPPRPGEPTDAELDAACAARQKPQPPLQMLAAMLGNAGPRDAAELVADAVRGTPDPRAVARALVPMLEQIVRAPERRPLAV